MNQRIFLLSQKKGFIPITLLGFTILAFAPLIPFLGFYWDGWPYLWQYHVFGPAGYTAFVASDRPYSAFIFQILTWLFSTHAIYYHIFTLLCRWLSGWAFWWILQQLWPKNSTFNVYAAVLFILYPGFLQQPIALPYCHHFSHMALFLFSIGAMLASLHDHKRAWLYTLLALIAQLNIFSLEYFASLEFIRPVLISISLRNEILDKKQRRKKALILWIPYLIILAAFYYWRIFIFSFPTYELKMLNEINQNFSIGISNLFSQVIKDFITVTFSAYKNIFTIPKIRDVGYYATYGYWGMLGIAVLFSVLTLQATEHSKRSDQEQKDFHQKGEVYLISILAILFAGIIFWATKLSVRIEFAWDRLTLAYMFGVTLFITSLIFTILRKPSHRIIFTTALISLTIGFHFLNAMDFKHDWDSFKDFFWQLSWRIPDLKENTIVMTTQFPLKYYSDNSLTAPLNWTYDPNSHDATLSYVFYFSDVRLKVGRLKALEKNLPVEQWYRSFSFSGNTTNTIVIRYKPPNCLQVLDSRYANAGIIPNLTDLEAAEIPLSNLDRIITAPKKEKYPPIEIIGEEIKHGWCYYFEKAELARQEGDWQKVIILKEEANALNLSPRNPSEWLPFFEAYVQTAQWDEAISLIKTSVGIDEKYIPGILMTWDRIMAEKDLNPTIEIQAIIDSLRN